MNSSNKPSGTRVRAGILLVVLAVFFAAIICLGYAHLRWRALDFNAVDYSYYYQFAAKLARPELAQALTWPPKGMNLFGLAGIEGQPGFHASVHFEPVKYVYAALLAVRLSPPLVFGFIFIVFAAPALYLAYHLRNDVRAGAGAVLACIYLFLPTGPLLVAYDLRPYALIGPLFCLSMLSIYLRRPSGEMLALFFLQFLAREESLIFAALTLAFAVAMKRRVRLVLLMAASYLAYGIAITAFFKYSALAPVQSAAGTPHVMLSPLLVTGLALGCIACLYALCRVTPRVPWPAVVACSVVIPLWVGFGGLPSAPLSEMMTILFSERMSLALLCGWLLLALAALSIVRRGGSERLSPLVSGPAVALALVFLLATMRPLVGPLPARLPGSAIVWELKAGTRASETRILCDRSTYQAFCEYNNVDILGRLARPQRATDAEDGPGPAQRILGERCDAFAVSAANFAALSKVAADELAAFSVTRRNLDYVVGIRLESATSNQ